MDKYFRFTLYEYNHDNGCNHLHKSSSILGSKLTDVSGPFNKISIDGLVQERRNSSALAMELRLSCIIPSILRVPLPIHSTQYPPAMHILTCVPPPHSSPSLPHKVQTAHSLAAPPWSTHPSQPRISWIYTVWGRTAGCCHSGWDHQI